MKLALILAAVGAGLVFMRSDIDMNAPRGIRNNNPGNIRISNANWMGKVTGADSAFETFSHPVYGIRALARILKNYQSKYSLNTVSQLLNRWAPPVENDTRSYAAAVAKKLGVGVDQVIQVDAYLPQLVDAIIHHENGIQPYTPALIEQGIKLA